MNQVRVGFFIPVLLFVLISLSVIGFFVYNLVFVLSEHTRITGVLVAEPAEARVGEPVVLEISFSEQYQRVYRLNWYSKPAGTSQISFQQVTFSDRNFDSEGRVVYPTYDRKARFTAERAGTYRIYVEGFYKQNNPQRIARIKVRIFEP
ncbi:MAG: hypothetical protein ACLFRY_08025 [Spirochaetia bacterium]